MGLGQTSLGNNGLRKMFASSNTAYPSRKSLQKTSNIIMGNNGLWKILASANTPPPSGKSLQKTSNIVMAKVDKLNEVDMSRRCRQLVDISRLHGSKSPHDIPVQCEGTSLIHCTQKLAKRCSSQRNKLCTPLLRMSLKAADHKNGYRE